jgi:hypothetical protein
MRRVLLLVSLFLCATASAWGQPTTQTVFAFVLLGEGNDGRPVPMVRAVVEGASACPVMRRATGVWEEMTPRQRPDGGRFDNVLVCEALYPVGEAASVLAGEQRINLSAVSLGTPRRVLLVGDTGCRGEDVARKPQSCTGGGFAKAWPFGTLSDEERRNRPDLIVHVGDYNYRGTPRGMVLPPSVTGYREDLKVEFYDTGDLDDEDVPDVPLGAGYWSQNIEGSPIPDKWENWRDDFFIPAAHLLPAAPWLLARGNHELCSRAGPGWFYLLDAGSSLLGPGHHQESCPSQTPPGWRRGAWPKPPALPFAGQPFPTRTNPPFRIKLGGLDVVVIDSSNAADAVLYNYDAYLTQYRAVATMLANDPTPTWLVTHRPIWGIVTRDKGGSLEAPYGFINVTQRAAVGTVFPNGFPPQVTAVIAGHMHRFQAIGFGGHQPPHLAVGTGGMELSSVQPVPSPEDPKRPVRVPDLDKNDAFVVGLQDFAAMVVTVGERGRWTSTLVGTQGETLATCDSTWPGPGKTQSVCALK